MAADASSSAVGCACAKSIPCAASPARSWYVRTCSSFGSFSGPTPPSRAAPRPRTRSRPPRSAPAGTRRRSWSCSRRRDADGADLRQREVDQRPVEAVLSQDRERVTLRDAAREEPVRVGADELVGVAPGDLAPTLAVVLDEVGRGRAVAAIASRHSRAIVRRRRAASSSRSRAVSVISSELTRRGSGRGGEITRSVRPRARRAAPHNYLMRTSWNGSLSFGLVSIPVGLAPATKPAARQSDVSFRLLHREARRRSSRSGGVRPTIAR